MNKLIYDGLLILCKSTSSCVDLTTPDISTFHPSLLNGWEVRELPVPLPDDFSNMLACPWASDTKINNHVTNIYISRNFNKKRFIMAEFLTLKLALGLNS